MDYNDEISLRELIMILIKKWKLIISITMIFVLVAFVYFWMIAKPVYESRINGTINIPIEVVSKYGTYTFPSRDYNEYLNLVYSDNVLKNVIQDLKLNYSIENIKRRISVNYVKDSSSFTFSITSDDPLEAKELMESTNHYYLKEVDLVYKRYAINTFLKDKHAEVQILDDQILILSQNLNDKEELLATINPTIVLQKLITADAELAAQIAKERNLTLRQLPEYTVFEEVINPNYLIIEEESITLRQEISEISLQKEVNDLHIKELNEELDILDKHYDEGFSGNLKSQKSDFMRLNIFTSEYATLPESPIAPNKMLSLAIATVLGLMTGVFAAFFIEYWNNSIDKKQTDNNI